MTRKPRPVFPCMVLAAFLCTLFLANLRSFVAAPTMDRSSYIPERPHIFPGRLNPKNHTARLRSVNVDAVDSLLLAPPEKSSAPTEAQSIIPTGDPNQYPFSFSYMSATPSQSPKATETTTLTVEEPTTVTVSAAPTTVTATITVTTVLKPSSITDSSTSPSSTHVPGKTSQPKAVWEAPQQFTNLDSFQVSRYSGGQKNIKIVTGIPAAASSRPSTPSPAALSWDNRSSVMQLLYPEGSIDPAQKPQGGAEFYAAPLDIGDAHSVSLRYSVFVPVDFDWVLGGKLPGLYGGHTGCSGGNAALDCFSTRLMWRPGGAGELYLYAPKDKQTKALCTDPKSVCDAAYGLSVGRGSFKWATGAWTTVEQTVVLNTPGKQDGMFELLVNGEVKISRSDIFYREDMGGGKAGAKTTRTPHRPTATDKTSEKPSPTGDEGLGPVLGSIIGGLGLRARGETISGGTDARSHSGTPDLQGQNSASTPAPTPTQNNESNLHLTISPVATDITSTAFHTPNTTTLDAIVTEGVTDSGASLAFGAESVSKESDPEVRLIGIFFSTFFGGHEDKYATPRDQYMWFKDFALSYNS